MWVKIKNIFSKQAQLPTVQMLPDKIRVFYSSRKNKKSRIFYFEVDKDHPEKIIYQHKSPILEEGYRGCFDDCGVMPSSVCDINGSNILYYTGWNIDKGMVAYGHGIGCANIDDIRNVRRVSIGPVIDRNINVPYLANSGFVTKFQNKYQMIFCNGNKWIGDFPTYHLNFAYSKNGLEWCIDSVLLHKSNCALSRACHIKSQDTSNIWFSMKSKKEPYKIMHLCTKGNRKILKQIKFYSNGYESWDNEMKCYPYVFLLNGKYYMYYNGNDYGQTGIGLAIWQ